MRKTLTRGLVLKESYEGASEKLDKVLDFMESCINRVYVDNIMFIVDNREEVYDKSYVSDTSTDSLIVVVNDSKEAEAMCDSIDTRVSEDRSVEVITMSTFTKALFTGHVKYVSLLLCDDKYVVACNKDWEAVKQVMLNEINILSVYRSGVGYVRSLSGKLNIDLGVINDFKPNNMDYLYNKEKTIHNMRLLVRVAEILVGCLRSGSVAEYKMNLSDEGFKMCTDEHITKNALSDNYINYISGLVKESKQLMDNLKVDPFEKHSMLAKKAKFIADIKSIIRQLEVA